MFGVVGIAGNQRRVTGDGSLSFLQASNWLRGLLAALTSLAGVAVSGTRSFDPSRTAGRLLVAFAIAVLLVIAGYCLLPVAVGGAAYQLEKESGRSTTRRPGCRAS